MTAMLLTHYFGFAQNLGPVLDFCAQHGITLIEDCSHALFVPTDSVAGADAAHGSGQNLNRGMGQTGRYGMASPYKFFASQDGGLLWANAPDASPLAVQTPQPLKQQIKGIVHALQAAQAGAASPPQPQNATHKISPYRPPIKRKKLPTT
jgi:hypothetical protein